MFLNITAILATLNISKPVTKDGQDVEPDITPMSDGILSFVVDVSRCSDRIKLTFLVIQPS